LDDGQTAAFTELPGDLQLHHLLMSKVRQRCVSFMSNKMKQNAPAARDITTPNKATSLLPVRKPGHRLFRRICVAVDASIASESAARLAISLVRGDARAELAFCHVVNVPRALGRAESGTRDYSSTFEDGHKDANALLDRCAWLARRAGVFARTYMRLGEPAAEIAAFAESIGCDLIAIGNAPSEKFPRLLNGSLRDEIVRICSCPVLVADMKRARPIEFRPRNILVAEADSPTASRAKRFAAELASEYGAELVLLPTDHDASDVNVSQHRLGLVVAGIKPRGFNDLFPSDCIERFLHAASLPILLVPDGTAVKNPSPSGGSTR
jgi:nucleotide-binding universal stress UspA family protein